MTKKSPTPAREIALFALLGSEAFPGDMLEEVVMYAFDQLCFRRTANELDALIERLRALVAEDA